MNRRGLFKGLFGVTGGVAANEYLLNAAWWSGPYATTGYGSGSVWQQATGGMHATITVPATEENTYEMIDYMLTPMY